jgi:transcriptional regulator with XRE-family HTH domain
MLCRRQSDQGVCFCNYHSNISKNQTIQKYPNKLKVLDNLASIAYTLTMTTDTLAEVPTPGSHKGNGGGHIPDTENNVGNIVEEIRKGASITQKRLASMAGLSTLYIIRAEQGMSLTLPNGLLLALSGVDPYHRDPHKIQTLYMKQREDMINYFLDRVHNKGITNDTTYPSNNDILQQALDYALDNYVPAVGSKEGPKASHPLYSLGRSSVRCTACQHRLLSSVRCSGYTPLLSLRLNAARTLLRRTVLSSCTLSVWACRQSNWSNCVGRVTHVSRFRTAREEADAYI